VAPGWDETREHQHLAPRLLDPREDAEGSTPFRRRPVIAAAGPRHATRSTRVPELASGGSATGPVAVKQCLDGGSGARGAAGAQTRPALLDCAVRSRVVAMSSGRGAPRPGQASTEPSAPSPRCPRSLGGRRLRPTGRLACRCLSSLIDVSPPQSQSFSTPRWLWVRGVPRPAPAPVRIGFSPPAVVGSRAGPPALHMLRSGGPARLLGPRLAVGDVRARGGPRELVYERSDDQDERGGGL
jgi:hypothetical protein